MTDETQTERARRKFAFGVLEQMSNILGSMAATVMVVGLVLPSIAAFAGMGSISRALLVEGATLVVGFAVFAGVAAAVLRGLARQIDDDTTGRRRGRRAPKRDDLLTGGS